MGTGIKDKYNVAINGKGYILRGAPNKPSYFRSIVPTGIDRLAISDIAYSDFSGAGVFYIAQTDWSAGLKDETKWRDDGKFYYSTNIDAYSEQGSLKAEKQFVEVNTFTGVIYCGGSLEVNSTTYEYVGLGKESTYPRIYSYNGLSWTDIAGTTFGTNQNLVSHVVSHKNKLWAGTVGNGNTNVIKHYDGSSWTDVSAAALTAFTSTSMSSALCFEEVGDVLYVAVVDSSAHISSILTTDDEGSTFTEVYMKASTERILSMRLFDGKIYFLTLVGSTMILRAYDPVAATTADVPGAKFYGCSARTYAGSNLLQVFGGKLVITIPTARIYEFDGSTLSKIYEADENKVAIGKEAYGYLYYGCIEINGRLEWSNLIYDGEAFFNGRKIDNENPDHYVIPLYVNSSGVARYAFSVGQNTVWSLSGYKNTIGSNFMVFNEMAPISKIDKLLQGVTLIFDPLAANETIRLDYSIDNRTTWTTLATLNSASEGSSTKRDIALPSTVLFNKIWFRLHLSGTTTTPSVQDFVAAYLPMPDFKNRWTLRLNMSDSFSLLNGQKEQRSGKELNAEFWNARVAKQHVLFEDVDYVECTLVSAMTSAATSALVSNTERFPRQGRIRAVSAGVAEEMTYTSATVNKILGISRAKRGTRNKAYAAGQTLKNDYDVYIDDIQTILNFTDEEKDENIIQTTLIEA